MKAGFHMRLVFIALMALSFSIGAIGHPKDTCKIDFRINSSYIQLDYMDNSRSIARLKSFLSNPDKIDSLYVNVTSSPDGLYVTNEWMTDRRANRIKDFILKNSNEDLDSNIIRITTLPEDWSGLQVAIEKNYTGANKDEILEIMNDKSLESDQKKHKIRALDYGVTWHYFIEEYMDDLRHDNEIVLLWKPAAKSAVEPARELILIPVGETESATEAAEETVAETATRTTDVTVAETATETANVTVTETATETAAASEPASTQPSEPENNVSHAASGATEKAETKAQQKKASGTSARSKGFCMGIKTNLIYDAACIPNLGLEFHLGRRWSLAADYCHAWWANEPENLFWRIYGGELGLRKYFGGKSHWTPLSGHHLGIYGQCYTYDFELGEQGQMSPMTYGAGIEYGYSVPLCRSLNLDFGLGAGYLGGEYYVYDPDQGCYVWERTMQRHWFGPTKFEISLIWIIGGKTSSNKK